MLRGHRGGACCTGISRRSYNVGSGEALTIPQIANLAADAIAGADIELVPGADVHVPDVQTDFDIGRIGRDLGWRPVSAASGREPRGL